MNQETDFQYNQKGRKFKTV